tara:strand:- start:2614 stop:2862 length:249 start_codon:yes stop_codon:yes gene_type:complete
MPRYAYRCSGCKKDITLFHLISEAPPPCPGCNKTEDLTKLLSTFVTKQKDTSKQKVGDTTEGFIKTAAEELKQQKRDLKDKR